MIKINIKKTFEQDYITREAGEKLRIAIGEAFKKKQAVSLDFTDLMVASTSFFDEGIAKLVLDGFSVRTILSQLVITGLYPRDREVLVKMCKVRGWDSVDFKN